MAIAGMTRMDRLQEVGKALRLDAFLLTSPGAVKCFSGYFYNFETGSSPFHLVPAALLILPPRATGLLLADNERDKATALHPGVTPFFYSSYTYEGPPHFLQDFPAQLLEMIEGAGIGNARIGVEASALPHSVGQAITVRYPGTEFRDITATLSGLKAIKDDDEIDCIRKAAVLCDLGQSAVLRYARAGMTELELFSHVRLDMEIAAGTRLPMMTDLVSGAATATGGGNPTHKMIREGELIISDLTPCLDGYWGDSCNTVSIGGPTAAQKDHYRLVKEALEIGINAIRPGVPANKIDRLMRTHLAVAGGYGHHSGHGVGTAYHEEPRIVPYNTDELQPGMVIALEPALYKEDYGIRLEHLVVVTRNGCDLLTGFRHSLEQY
jgi:Xaa-Pro aminopeptidase